MSSLFSDAYWCILQVTFISLAGLVVASFVKRNRPARACAVLSLTVCLSLILTASSFLPIDHYVAQAVSILESSPTQTATSSITSATLNSREIPIVADMQSDRPLFSITTTQLIAVGRSLAQKAEVPRRSGSGWLKIGGWACLIGLCIGAVGLLSSWLFVFTMRRKGVAIDDPVLRITIKSLSAQLQCEAVPVAESSRVSSAAIAGFVRPVLVLPTNWRNWNSDELKTVLAHELAHVARRDSAWRTFACGIQAIHFFNPLVHRLLNQLILYQELAADQLAANAVGQRCYLRSLTTLALQQDEARQGCPAIVPVFTGHLTRRIKMLNSTDGTQSASERKSRSTIAIATLAILGIATAALPGFAQITVTQTVADETSEARATNETPKAVTSDASSVPNYGRKPIPPSILGPNSSGMLQVRVGELTRTPLYQNLEPFIRGQLVNYAARIFPELKPETIDLSAVEWVASVVNMTIDRNANTKDSAKHSLAMGANGLTVRFHEDVDLASWMKQNGTDVTTSVSVNGQTIHKVIKPMGLSVDVRVRQTDPRTIQVGTFPIDETDSNDARFAKMFKTVSNTKVDAPRWHRPWETVAGALASAVVTDANIRTAIKIEESGNEFDDSVSHLIAAMLQRCTSFAYGFDLNKKSDLGVQFRCTHASVTKAHLSADELRNIQKKLNTPAVLTKLKAGTSGIQAKLIEDAAVAFENATISVIANSDESADLVVVATMPIDISGMLSNGSDK